MKFFFACLLSVLVMPAVADVAIMESAMDDVRKNCGGLSEQLTHLKNMAGINTAVTGVGTGVGAGALATGIVKSKRDAEIAELEKHLEKLRAAADKNDTNLDVIAISDSDIDATVARVSNMDKKISALESEIQEKTEKSITLGNVRTGLMATNTATNIAGAVIAGTNQIKDDLETKIGQCILSVNKLNSVYMQARIQADADAVQIARAESIISACGAWETVNADITSVNKRARGAAISAGIGAGIGLAGTITSGVANSEKVRSGDTDKEKNINTASNVLAGGATVASATATVFNATQIAAVKRVVDVADICEGALQ